LAEQVAERVAAELGVEVRLGLGRPVRAIRSGAVTTRPGARWMRWRWDSDETSRWAAPIPTATVIPVLPCPKPAGPAHASRPTRIWAPSQLLLSLQDDEALRLFCDSILGPIEHSEGHYGGELMRSLEAFIEENGQWEKAARRLYCHRHTLRYRIRRVEELTGRDLGSAGIASNSG